MRKNTESLGLFCPSDLLPTGRGRERVSMFPKLSMRSDSKTNRCLMNTQCNIAGLMCRIDDNRNYLSTTNILGTISVNLLHNLLS